MDFKQFFSHLIPLVATLLLSSCGGGGSAGDTLPVPATPSAAVGPNSFLLFPNPQVQSDGTLQTDTTGYAQAYYQAIDPTNAKDTLAKWKAANGFGSGTGQEVTVVIGDTHDLGYGRRMTARRNPDGTIAMMVDNYVVSAATSTYGAYTHLNVDAAVNQDSRWFIGTTAIDFSPAPGGTVPFAKFYFFDPVGNRAQMASLDGRTAKAMPGICVNCHGGRDDPLTPATGSPTGLPLFPLVQNTASLARGDLTGHFHELKVDVYDYSTTPGYTRADEEANLKTINQMILCSYPLAGASAYPEDACRRTAQPYEWQGGNDVFIKNAYGGNGMPNATYSNTYVPSSWQTAGETTLFQGVLQQVCITCHILRGTGLQPDIDFSNYATFPGYVDRIDSHVFDRGNMPLAKFVYDRFWASGSTMPNTLAAWMANQGSPVYDSSGAVLQPGRPYAYPGPDRVVSTGSTTLSATNSLFASTYTWSFVSNPGGATLTNPNTATPVFTATTNGTYVLQLVVGDGTTTSTAKQLTIVVDSALSPLPSAIRFSNIKTVLQTAGCTNAGCHSNGTTSLATAANTPILYTSVDRNGDSVIDATDDLWFYTEVRGRINFTDIVASPLLRKPSGNHHNGALVAGFDTSKPPGDPARANYDLFLNWILNGAPQ